MVRTVLSSAARAAAAARTTPAAMRAIARAPDLSTAASLAEREGKILCWAMVPLPRERKMMEWAHTGEAGSVEVSRSHEAFHLLALRLHPRHADPRARRQGPGPGDLLLRGAGHRADRGADRAIHRADRLADWRG